ncbi:hypothetical protein D3C76_1231820 [compost metagenome]
MRVFWRCISSPCHWMKPLSWLDLSVMHRVSWCCSPVGWCCALQSTWSDHSTIGSVKCLIINPLRRSKRKVIIRKALSGVWRLPPPSFCPNTMVLSLSPKVMIQRSLTRFMRLLVIGGTQVGRRIIIDISSTPQTGTSRSRTITCNM